MPEFSIQQASLLHHPSALDADLLKNFQCFGDMCGVENFKKIGLVLRRLRRPLLHLLMVSSFW